MCVADVYACLWESCGFESSDSNEIVRHVNFHSYHTKIKCIGSNILARSRLPVSDEHSTCKCFTLFLLSAKCWLSVAWTTFYTDSVLRECLCLRQSFQIWIYLPSGSLHPWGRFCFSTVTDLTFSTSHKVQGLALVHRTVHILSWLENWTVESMNWFTMFQVRKCQTMLE